MIATFSEIERCYKLSSREFQSNYVEKAKPVIITGLIKDWSCYRKWSLEYFSKITPELKIYVKSFKNNTIQLNNFTLEEYTNILEKFEITKKSKSNIDLPPYCHDLPLFSLIPSLIKDVQPFPLNYLPEWYWHKWWRHCQFFLGASSSLTPLHFDCLLTNNLFFQISGRKRFTLIMANDAEYCYRHGWRWFMVDPENPDLEKYPQYKRVNPITFIVNPGDILYMPPGTLHHVRSLDMSVSFNIDWHTKKSSLNSLASVFRGMPPKNLYYNFLLTMGLGLKVPQSIIFPFYKSYLNYVS
ncbi:MAG: cupin-like domain-containing protein [Symploca sp. SIO3C6]|uniref:Cupin-like domain-containing protein n=1 Tax=Symploca sp. SIO1C4 TaxID=2607765 RepID=A0A6B3N1T2_9CYAN|nr:cupin-like domain-containing protein [Symploca sp. SIO3C6]NER27069.1 cupin-like domain-containing protein [Symploca sp. SIO1C4]